MLFLSYFVVCVVLFILDLRSNQKKHATDTDSTLPRNTTDFDSFGPINKLQ